MLNSSFTFPAFNIILGTLVNFAPAADTGQLPVANNTRPTEQIPTARVDESELGWILARQTPHSGAFLYTRDGHGIQPYFTNLALTNVLRVNTSDTVKTAVKRWINWYISKLEYPPR